MILAPRLMQADSVEADAAFREGMEFAHAQKWEDARAAFLIGQRRMPEDKRFAIELAGVAYRMGSRKEAIGHLRRALEIDAADPYANDAVGSLYLLEGNIDAALKYWNRIDKPRIRDVSMNMANPRDADSIRLALGEIAVGAILLERDLAAVRANLGRIGMHRYKFELLPTEDSRFDLAFTAGNHDLASKTLLARGIAIASELPYQTLSLTLRPGRPAITRVDTTLRFDPNKRRVAAQAAGLAGRNPRLAYRTWFDARDEQWELPNSSVGGRPAAPFRLRMLTGGFAIEDGLSHRLTWTNGVAVSARDYRGAAAGPLFSDGIEVKASSGIAYTLVTPCERRLAVTAGGGGEFGRQLSLSGPFGKLHGYVAGEWQPDRGSLEFRSMLHVAKTFGSIPFDEQYVLGMERDNNLWLRGHVATSHGRKGNAPMGPAFVLAQTDAARTISRSALVKWQLGPFVDTGSVTGQYGSRGWLLDTGVESRLHLMRSVELIAVAGHDIRNGGAVFYTAVRRR